ncbi:V-type H(+)-translocating pyrophosphatase [Pirellula staleyi DSM 6068]|uniref:Putative K(+)-stimulated pyrophosphate-energized sodium pump n=1 Tax=Pirellula staleyi (strain ATCC 27377 / DSM 6068 / ICPB 4128) TaxID=530564 RepID=D2R777_PIRSD|nr:sodium-translocating pyrophosphatase [Pirellula staleyi]ADB15573.1 V-type H(+)-translocating pyrophosphatase [Pirellula staleyi DSM 6068]
MHLARNASLARLASLATIASAPLLLVAFPATLLAQEPAAAQAAGSFGVMEYVWWTLCLVASIAALVQAWVFYKAMMASDEGTPKMVEIAGYVRTGAAAYLNQQYKVVAIFFVVIGALLAVQAFYLKVQSEFVPFAFITGGLFSGLAGYFGMKTATWASSRTAAAAQKSLNQGLQVAFRSGAVMGLVVVGLGLLDITLWYALLRWVFGQNLQETTVAMLCFGMGASSQALFARVGGGIFTKAADVGADLVGKVEQGIPEDDPRNPATIADNVGDNVGDVAGMGADLYESYCGSILATAALGVAAFLDSGDMQLRAMFLPLAIAGVGIFLSIIGMYLIRTGEDATQKHLLAALANGINAATLLSAAASIALTWLIMPGYLGIAGSVIVGLVAGWMIGKWTEYSTSDEYQPTKELAAQSLTGPATVIIGGIAEGMISTWFPVVVVAVGTLLAFGFSTSWNFADVQLFSLGLYGVGIAAVGMLSTLGITLATDAYGPIADNAGGNAEMAHLGPEVRKRTDALDSLGNTTAATGKGFAIGSAALTALALLAAYVEEVRIGFDRWGKSPEIITETADDGYYKINDRFVVHKEGSDRKAWEMYLVMPDDARMTGWKKGTDQELATPAGIASKLSIDEANITGDKTAMFLTIAGLPQPIKLVNLHRATLPDFAAYYDATLINPKSLVGMFLGAMSVFVFCAMTMKAVGRAAKGMVEEVRRQFKEKPGIMKGTELPDYAAPVAISTKAAQREMILPSLLGLLTPVAVGMVLGVGGVLGLLVGCLSTGFCVAIFMANSGGSWDNAKKHIEAGNFGGKGTDAHKAAVVGDTVGDPFKDTSGPSLNILIKLMSMVSVVVAGLVVRYSLEALGIF